MSFFRLKDLIRAVRVCKTAADERNVIQRESAAIRTSFKEVDTHDARFVNIQKLLYIYLLGFPVQFGQLECLKLAASARFSDKRVGYLGVTLLLDEKQEILTLLTNSLKTDMNSADDYTVGLALCTLANVGSAAVANDLVDEVERLLGSPRSYVRKKAALAAVRVVRREPELATSFVSNVRALLGDKHHGVQLSATALLSELCMHSQDALDEGRRLVPLIVRQLRSLVTGSSHEHEVGEINDPFLQAALLRLLCVVARGSQDAADEVNDVLTQVATQTDGAKNVGTAILYECAVTALAIPSESALRVLAINLLGTFLAHKESNVRYVALATLSAAVITEAPAVQRHRATVVQCMRDGDISIRRRALDLSFALINAQNVHVMVADILRVLPHADMEFRSSMVYRLSAAITLFGDSYEWRAEHMLRVLSLGGSYLNNRDLFKFLRMVITNADETLQRRVVRTCFALLERDISQDKMVVAGVWLIGEYADLLVASGQNTAAVASPASGGGLDADDLDILGALGRPIPKKEASPGAAVQPISLDEELPQTTPEPLDIVRLLARVARSSVVSRTSRHMALTSLAKLSGRFSDQPAVAKAIREALAAHKTSMDAESQARAAEFDTLLSSELDSVRSAVVERMPAPEYTDVPYEEYVLNPTAMRMRALMIVKRPALQPEDLIAAGVGGGDSSAASAAAASAAAAEATKQSVVSDLLNLMDDAPSTTATPPVAPPMSPPSSAAAVTSPSALADLFAASSVSPAVGTEPGFNQEYSVYDANGLSITLTPSKKPKLPTVVDILATFHNNGEAAVSDLNFLVAVPKSQKLQILPPSSQTITCGSSVTQVVRVSNPSKTSIRLRMKLSYTSDGQSHDTMFDFGANNRRRSAALDNGDKVQKAKGEPECIKRAKWGPEDDEKLTNLIKGGTLDDTVLVKTFPQFPMSRIQQAIRSLTRKRNNRDTTWTKEQDEELLRRIKEHGFRWTLVSKMYLISKTPLRCRERYLQLTNVNTISFSRWTKEETEKLIDVVIAHLQEQQIKKEQSHLNKLVNTLALRKYEAVLSAKNKAILDVINEDKPNGTAIDVVRSNLIKGVDWSWVASRMGKRTSSQCEYRFWYKFAKQYKERSYYRGPWSREEDRLVYELQREKDMPIRVVLSKLPNKRTRESVICRYATYILPIVGILKQCRGPDWDPLADGFKEVHERCEIWAWYYRKLEGYRVNDQFECPHDMDLTGYYKWCKEMPEDADIQ
ncbi:clathrin associated protein complex large subunit [Coemansia sp. Benny D115]|nr:clathrin associated protein complex large subunit [Coemansia sp. Benny D115]